MLYNRIKHFRTHNGLDTETVAKAIKIDHSEYLKYESGELSPTIDAIEKLSHIYKVTVGEFYGHEPRLAAFSNLNTTDEEKPVPLDILKLSGLSIDEVDVLLAYRNSPIKEYYYTLITQQKRAD